MKDADIFIGCSGPRSIHQDEIKLMARDPLIFAMANPEPEIRPELVFEARPDAIMGTGRSDYPNQINNVMCFPFLFRGALDCHAKEINEAMKMAAAKALAGLAREEVPESVKKIYPDRNLVFGREYIIPTPFDQRLMETVSIEVARTAMETGVARKPIHDLEAYKLELKERYNKYVGRTEPIPPAKL